LLEKLYASLDAHSYETEAEYHQAFCTHVKDGHSLFQQALIGGLLAPRFGFVFSAGYQTAIRHIFPSLTASGWVAFAVSEDRNPEAPLPGVDYVEQNGRFELSGFKTWVAASDHCGQFIVSARNQTNGSKGTLYFLVNRAAPGVSVSTRPPGRMLPDLSQGKLELTQYMVAEPLNADRVKSFAAAEVLFIYLAFLASTWANFPARREGVETLLAESESLTQVASPSWDAPMLEFDGQVQWLLQDMRTVEGEAHALWRRDYKLISMYARQPKKDS
jgi:acyl-CoA dehydrogenase